MTTGNDKFHYQFIHNVFGCFIENTLDYFADYLYPRFQHKVVGTYDKAVEYITKKDELGREGDKPNLPALILNPTGDFNLDDPNSLAHQFWRFPHLAPGQAAGLFDPIYKDNNIEISVAFTRLKGEIELLALLPSFYEYFDLKIYFIQMFGGEGRYIEPMYFNDFLILPPELVNYQYTNDATGDSYKLDWSNNAYDFLVKTTNKNELVIPGKVKPRYVLRGMSDGSTRYGGADDLASWRLSTIVEYEIEIPSFIILQSNGVIENVDFNINYGSVYSTNSEYNIPKVPEFQEVIEAHLDSGLQENKNTIVNPNMNPSIEGDLTPPSNDMEDANIPPEPATPNFQETPPTGGICSGEKIIRSLEFKNRYFHKVTQAQSDSTSDILITLPEKIYDTTLLKVQSKHGLMEYGDHYIIENAGKDLKILVENVFLDAGDMLELFVYDVPFKASSQIFILGAASTISTTDETPFRSSMIVEWALTGTSKCVAAEQKPNITIG
jgi:hypothetical protein